MSTKRKRVVAVDFDGVIHRYSKGWHDGTCYDLPMEGAIDALSFLERSGCNLIVFTARPAEQVIAWLANEGITHLKVTNTKPVADVYIDDRGLHFQNWDQAINELIEREILQP